MKHLARVVVGGKLFIREPLNVIAQDEIRSLMEQNGLEELRALVGRVPLMGLAYEGAFSKKEQDHV